MGDFPRGLVVKILPSKQRAFIYVLLFFSLVCLDFLCVIFASFKFYIVYS